VTGADPVIVSSVPDAVVTPLYVAVIGSSPPGTVAGTTTLN
jgi:hypothetical protein